MTINKIIDLILTIKYQLLIIIVSLFIYHKIISLNEIS